MYGKITNLDNANFISREPFINIGHRSNFRHGVEVNLIICFNNK